jgi:aspartyl-tRNA(Asn)/glutamyl-tRNA(Gln) amidotransferase subunit A
MTIADYLHGWHDKNTFSQIVAQAKEKNLTNPAVLRRDDEYVLSCQEDQFLKPLHWLPMIIKDLILLEGTVSTFWSAIGIQYIAPYSATVVRKLEEAGAIIIGKSAMDEFAMGTTGENSPFLVPHTIYGKDRVAGWSSSGSAVAVALGMVPVALWTDTGWSIRLPASFCGIVWLKTTYGAVSRYGVQAYASSFEQVGVLSTTVADAETIFDVIKGVDPFDATTQDHHRDTTPRSLLWLRIGLPKQYFQAWLDAQIKASIFHIVDLLVAKWAIIVELDIPLIDSGVSVYYTLVPAEMSSNLARFDGLKFWLQANTYDSENHMKYLSSVRSQGFWDEATRRILLWAHILSASEYEGLYVKAMDIRTVVTKQFKDHFAQDVDVIFWPMAPTLPRKKWSKMEDPIAMYLADAYTVIANLTGMPAMSIPIWFGYDEDEKLPIWLQMMWDHWSEYVLLALGKEIEQLTGVVASWS